MSFFKGEHGEKIRELWMNDEREKEALRKWLDEHEMSWMTLTNFTFLEHHELKRREFLEHHKRRRMEREEASKVQEEPKAEEASKGQNGSKDSGESAD